MLLQSGLADQGLQFARPIADVGKAEGAARAAHAVGEPLELYRRFGQARARANISPQQMNPVELTWQREFEIEFLLIKECLKGLRWVHVDCKMD